MTLGTNARTSLVLGSAAAVELLRADFLRPVVAFPLRACEEENGSRADAEQRSRGSNAGNGATGSSAPWPGRSYW